MTGVLITLGVIYVVAGSVWFGAHTVMARESYSYAERAPGKRAAHLRDARDDARNARRAPYWLFWVILLGLRLLGRAVRDTRRIAHGRTELQMEQLEQESRELQNRIKQLRADQADDREEFHRGGGL